MKNIQRSVSRTAVFSYVVVYIRRDLEQRILDLDVTPSPGTGTTEEPDSEVDLTPLTCSDVAMTRKQRSLCHKGEKSMMFAIGQGVIAAKHHCRKQFKHSRWNCTVPPGQQGAFGDIALYGELKQAVSR